MAKPVADRLDTYRAKRNFGLTSEPDAAAPAEARDAAGVFVIQKHAASRLHYDFRLELDGVLLSWALPRGASYDPLQKRLAVRTEDHPLGYATFEGTIPPKQYGAGTVIVWDEGTWTPTVDPRNGLAVGKIIFELHGQKLAGLWELVRIQKPGEKQEPWILFKKRDAWVRPLADYDVVSALPDSVLAKPLGLVEQREPRGTPALEAAAPVAGAAALKSAPSAALPEALSPQLATLAASPPAAGEWAYEIKFDGYRILARIDGGTCRLFTRNGNDWTDKMTSLARAVEQLGIESGWLDGEAVVMGDDGMPSFNALQKAFDRVGTETIQLFLFDAPYLDGKDLRALSLRLRRAILKERLGQTASERIRFSEEFVAPGASVLESACKMGLEGVIAKRLDSAYELRRTETWLKLKCHRRQEFVIGGFTDRSNASKQVGSLLLGVYDDAGKLRSVGSVGTGWNTEESAALWRQLAALESAASRFDPDHAPAKGRWSKRATGSERWVEPALVAEVSFAEWTPDGSIRHASFEGLREDKDASAIRREIASAVIIPPVSKKVAPTAARNAVATVKVTHGERVIDASTGLTKLDLVRYYESVAEFILPHLRGRPCSLVRGPSGVEGQLFFQKHSERTAITGLKDMDQSLWPEHDPLLEVPDAMALAGAAQMNTIEFHTWNSTAKKIDQPDRMIFDLDPGEGTTWQQIQEAATLVRGFLQELELEAWLKTSGGKGLHVVVPLTPKFDYDTVKSFSKSVVEHLAKVIPSRFVAKSGPANRVGKLFVDYLRNGHGATTAAAFSARARPGIGVSMPVAWEELAKLKGGNQWTVVTAREHLSFQKVDPWAGYWKKKQTLTAAMKTLVLNPLRRAASPMRIATWNVNNVNKRLPLLLAWLDATNPDVVALQELKAEQAAFPKAALEAAGYASAWVGQKTWNGVALLARGAEPIVIRRELPGDGKDVQARYLEAAIDGVVFASLYLPNGNPWPGPKFAYKLAWFERLIAHAAELMASGHSVVLAGDYNVVPTDADIYSPASWLANALLQPEPREAYARLLAQGWTDALRTVHPKDAIYTFWDFRRQRWQRQRRLAIDHLLLSASLRERLVSAGVDLGVRGMEETSDHAPAWIELKD